MALLDWVRVLLGIGVTIYAYLSYRKLRGGTMAEPYKIFTICGIAGTCSSVTDALEYNFVHGLLGIVFWALLFLGFWFLYQTWTRFGK